MSRNLRSGGLEKVTNRCDEVALVDDRFNIIEPYVSNSNVLDVGCVGTDAPTELHSRIADHADEVLGIDINEELVERLERDDIIVANAEKFVPDDRFDTVVAGELIEHLNSPGDFLSCTAKNLHNDGRLIITTPNSFGYQYFSNRLLGREAINRNHTCWFDPLTLMQLAERYNFELEELGFLKGVGGIESVVTRVAPRFSRTFVAVFRLYE
jgi:2-polyprenyl-3-methyl-5-hydroxy-6-metoxy-1,4-benzoquinol methylase